jgi:thermitase
VAVAVVATSAVVPVSAAAGPELRSLDVQANRAYVPGEVLVRFEPGTSSVERRSARREAGVEFDDALVLPRTETVEVDGSVSAAVRRLERQPGVAYAQPNYRYEALAVEPPDDTLFEQLWGLSDPAKPDPGVSALEAWEDNKGAGQAIAVLDTGVDLTHPDIEGNLWTNTVEDLGLKGIDEDLNGQVDDVHGYDFVDDDGDPDDYQFHGTHVAGTAAAIADNSEGIAGVAPEAETMAVRVLDGDGSGSTAEIAEGIVYAAENGADVINMSLGGPAGNDQATEDAIELAGAEDTVVVAAAGNDGTNNDVEPHTPCSLPQANLICVAALNQNGALAGFSNFGVKSVDLAAPGTSILSAKTDYGPAVFSDDFESGLGNWSTEAFDGGIEWGPSTVAASGTQSATDSPSGNYGQAPDSSTTAESDLFTTSAIDLTGERGCRVHFRAMYEIEKSFDTFFAGAISDTPSVDGIALDGTSPGFPGSFAREEASISDLDRRDDVRPLFGIFSDQFVQLDGAYVDDVRLICRDESYIDAEVSPATLYDEPNVGNYVRFQGTSMAAPHVSGVVALVRAAAPSLNAVQVVNAVLTGASAIPTPSFTRRTATEGIADACQAIAVATGTDFTTECPGSSENVVPPPPPSVSSPGSGATPPGEEPPQVVDRRRPRTFIRQHPPKVVWTRTSKARVVFRFGSDEGDVTFTCRVDGGFFRPCGRRLVRRFRVGLHVIRVTARDLAGNVDLTPAVYRFKVKRRS